MLLRYLLLLSLTVLSVSANIRQIHVIHRHGARPGLDKNPHDTSHDKISDPRLFEKGVEQLRDLGKVIYDRYGTGDDKIPDISARGSFTPRSYSSNLIRTLTSARAFLMGFFKTDSGYIPTMVFESEPGIDWIIRGYAACDALNDKIKSFYNSGEFKRRKKAYEPTLKKYGDSLGLDNTQKKYEDIFDIYDEYLSIERGYDPTTSGTEKLSQTEFEKLKSEADWVESSKFAYYTHGIHVAGGLISEILKNIRSGNEKMYQYSAHYPTLLTLLASIRPDSLKRGDLPEDDPSNSIPDFGAALIIEVSGTPVDKTIKFFWYAGGDSPSSLAPIRIGAEPCTNADSGCKFKNFERILAESSLTKEKFETDCNVVLSSCSRSGGLSRPLIGSVGLLVGFILALIAMFVYMRFRQTKRSMATFQQSDSEVFA